MNLSWPSQPVLTGPGTGRFAGTATDRGYGYILHLPASRAAGQMSEGPEEPGVRGVLAAGRRFIS